MHLNLNTMFQFTVSSAIQDLGEKAERIFGGGG
jgi:hypothetical protein